MLKHIVPKFRPDLFVRFRAIAEKTGPREAETDCSCLLEWNNDFFFCQHIMPIKKMMLPNIRHLTAQLQPVTVSSLSVCCEKSSD